MNGVLPTAAVLLLRDAAHHARLNDTRNRHANIE